MLCRDVTLVDWKHNSSAVCVCSLNWNCIHMRSFSRYINACYHHLSISVQYIYLPQNDTNTSHDFFFSACDFINMGTWMFPVCVCAWISAVASWLMYNHSGVLIMANVAPLTFTCQPVFFWWAYLSYWTHPVCFISKCCKPQRLMGKWRMFSVGFCTCVWKLNVLTTV